MEFEFLQKKVNIGIQIVQLLVLCYNQDLQFGWVMLHRTKLKNEWMANEKK